MGHRLTKIATRTGDAGETGLADGSRVGKDHPRVRALGDIDELSCCLGLVLAEDVPAELRDALEQVQQDLFDLGGEVSLPGKALVAEAQVARLDAWLGQWNQGLPPLREFILPGGTRAAAAAHLARATCRRAERSLVALGRDAHVGEPARQYLNRLSDLLFVAGRLLNRGAGRADVQWRHERRKG